MKTYAHHDSQGSIKVLIQVNAPDGAGMMLSPRAGHFVAEVGGLTSSKATEPRKIPTSHRVAAPIPHCKLERMSTM